MQGYCDVNVSCVDIVKVMLLFMLDVGYNGNCVVICDVDLCV